MLMKLHLKKKKKNFGKIMSLIFIKFLMNMAFFIKLE